MQNPKVLIKMLNSRGSTIQQGLQEGLLREVFEAGEDQWVSSPSASGSDKHSFPEKPS